MSTDEAIIEAVKNSYVLDHIDAFSSLNEQLRALDDPSADDIQTLFYEVGKAHFSVLREWFAACYYVFCGSHEGPRIGQLFELVGVEHFLDQLVDRMEQVKLRV